MTEDNFLSVIGAGLGRTGTESLKKALEILYGEPCYHMKELIYKHQDHIRKWLEIDELTDKTMKGEQIDPKLFHEIFQDYRCTVDFPSASYYDRLLETYPNAKVVLTVRDAHTWVESVRETIIPKTALKAPGFFKSTIITLTWGWQLAWYCHSFSKAMFERCFGSSIDIGNDEQLRLAFEHWIDKVKRSVPPEKLLVFSVKDGWGPLCKFLNKPTPDEPFPKLNERKHLAAQFGRIRMLTRAFRLGLPIVLATVIAITTYTYNTTL